MPKSQPVGPARAFPSGGPAEPQTFHPLCGQMDIYGAESLLKWVMGQHKSTLFSDALQGSGIDSSVERRWILKALSFEEVLRALSKLGKTSCFDHSGIVIGDSFLITCNLSNNMGFRELVAEIFFKFTDQESLLKKVEKVLKPLVANLDSSIHLSVDWALTRGDRFDTYEVSELLFDNIYPEAYPYVDLEPFCRDYLRSPSSILILIGPQGTGKTRLIRYLLSLKGREKPKTAHEADVRVLYTTDPASLGQEEFYVMFKTRPYDFLVLEDIDKYLEPRKEGNELMHKFLGASDGIISAKRKIIFSTNLEIERMDQALCRPGRCHSVLHTRALDLEESRKLLNKLVPGVKIKLEGSEHTLAELYNLAFHTSGPSVYPSKKTMGFHNR